MASLCSLARGGCRRWICTATQPELRRYAGIQLAQWSQLGLAQARRSLPQTRPFFSLFGGGGSETSNDICNCGADLGKAIPRHELVLREGLERGSTGWTQQLYGAALYWHLASTCNERDIDPDLLRGKDVLEVGCMRGGGARYLAEVAGTQSYVATDISEEHVAVCRKLHSPWTGLRFEVVDATRLDETFEPESFDVILGVECVAGFVGDDLIRFLVVADKCLRPGGRLALCDMFDKKQLTVMMNAMEALGLTIEACQDLSSKVDFLGICRVSVGDTYARIVAVKPLANEASKSPADGFES